DCYFILLSSFRIPTKVLKPGDWEQRDRKSWRPQLGFNPNRQQAHLDQSGFRALGTSAGEIWLTYSFLSQNLSHRLLSSVDSRQNSLRGGAPPPSYRHQPPFPRPPAQRGGHGWDRAMQVQPSAYQHNMSRGQAQPGPGSYQQRFNQRRDQWQDRRDGHGHQVTRPIDQLND
ncbi:unnamed protein product, partial [Lampetra planeri]